MKCYTFGAKPRIYTLYHMQQAVFEINVMCETSAKLCNLYCRTKASIRYALWPVSFVTNSHSGILEFTGTAHKSIIIGTGHVMVNLQQTLRAVRRSILK